VEKDWVLRKTFDFLGLFTDFRKIFMALNMHYFDVGWT